MLRSLSHAATAPTRPARLATEARIGMETENAEVVAEMVVVAMETSSFCWIASVKPTLLVRSRVVALVTLVVVVVAGGIIVVVVVVEVVVIVVDDVDVGVSVDVE